jgi:tetratricopeptide (TPR) repeat protein
MSMHEEWTDRLSDYLDGELSAEECRDVEAHLRECASCSDVLNELKRVVALAQSIEPRPPRADLWAGIAERIDAAGRPSAQPVERANVTTFPHRIPRRIAFTLPQLAAAALVVAAVSGGIAWALRPSFTGTPQGVPYERVASAPRERSASAPYERSASADPGASAADVSASAPDAGHPFTSAEAGDARIETVGFADAQYDAAVADLQKALENGRGQLDASTIAVVEHNLQIIDQAINQAREALVADPANSYLSSHLVEARRRKLDLLRRATALTNEAG